MNLHGHRRSEAAPMRTARIFLANSARLCGRARQTAPLLAGGAAAATSFVVADSLGPARPRFARCDAAPTQEEYPFAPPKLDDPEYNAEVMRSWRTKIQDARESFSKMDFEGAERALQLALEQAGHFGQSSGPVATSLLNLAQLYRRTGRLSEAEPLLERAADVLDQTAGPNNKVTLLALIDLANTKLENGDPTGSLGGFRDVLARLDIAEANQKHGAAALSSVRAGCLFSMAKGHAALDEVDEAEARLREVLSMVEARWGDTSVRVLAPCAELVRITALQGRLGESRALLARARALPELKPQQVTKLADLERELKL